MRLVQFTFLFVFTSFFIRSYAQNGCATASSHSANSKSWNVSVGYAINDIRTPNTFEGFVKDYLSGDFDDLNARVHPNYISVEKPLSNAFSVQAMFTYNVIKKGYNYQVGDPLTDDKLLALNLKFNYDVNNLIGQTGFFDPYLTAGGGYSSIGNESDFKAIAGYGANLWFTDRWGLKLESSYNHCFQPTATDFFQHNIGLIFKMGQMSGPTWEK